MRNNETRNVTNDWLRVQYSTQLCTHNVDDTGVLLLLLETEIKVYCLNQHVPKPGLKKFQVFPGFPKRFPVLTLQNPALFNYTGKTTFICIQCSMHKRHVGYYNQPQVNFRTINFNFQEFAGQNSFSRTSMSGN